MPKRQTINMISLSVQLINKYDNVMKYEKKTDNYDSNDIAEIMMNINEMSLIKIMLIIC